MVVLICAILFILPFFWIAPGELEMGGDSNRLFLYDPGAYLQVNALYSVEPQGVGKVITDQSLLPFLMLLQLLSSVLHSPYLLMTLLNSVKLVGSFIFIYLIITELLSHHFGKEKKFHAGMASIVAGLFYTISPSVGENMRSALLTHNQVFLNPMIFYFVLRFLVTQQSKYLWFTLLTTLVFSPNFSLIAPPPPFAFYPLALFFLILYVALILKKSLPWKKLCIGFIFFLGIQAFHIIPAVVHISDPSSDYYTRAFDASSGRNEALDYFNATLSLGKVSQHIFFTHSDKMRWTAFAVPLVVILGLLLNKKRQKALMLNAIFFLITLYLVSANITLIGVEIYRKLFYLPGFSMFRVFYGQWQWVHAFFYALLFGFALFIVFSQLKRRYVYASSMFLIILFVISGWTFINGQVLRSIHPDSKNMTSIINMNPDYEKTLAFIKALPDDGKIFNFPFSDFFYQVVPGTNNAAYFGPSPTSYLTGKRTFSGYQIIYPFPEVFLKLAKEKNYAAIKRLFGILNINYIFYIRDPKAFTEYYPTWPYSLFLQSIPDSQALVELVDGIRGEKIFQQGFYSIYSADKANYLPHFYVPTSIKPYENNDDWYGKNVSFFVDSKGVDPRVEFIEREQCAKIFPTILCASPSINQDRDVPTISFKRVNPIKYRVEVSGATGPFTLIFSDQFHKDWKLYISQSTPEHSVVQESYFNGSIKEYNHENTFLNSRTFETLTMKSIPEGRHFMVNGYANAWYITPKDSSGREQYEIIIEMVEQRIFYYSSVISIISLFVFLLYGIKLLRK